MTECRGNAIDNVTASAGRPHDAIYKRRKPGEAMPSCLLSGMSAIADELNLQASQYGPPRMRRVRSGDQNVHSETEGS